MTLNPTLLAESFDLIALRGAEVVDRLYERLLELAPHTRPLFEGVDVARHREMVLATLVMVRHALPDLSAVAVALRELGARHVAYGARPEHYPAVGAALIDAMTEVAGAAWQPEYSQAWTAAFVMLSSTMNSGADEAVSLLTR